jgi:hypothetical protein
MQVALICAKCGKVHTEDTDGANLVVDFRQKQLSFICQNKTCNHDNIFSFEDWKDISRHSPLPKIRIM